MEMTDVSGSYKPRPAAQSSGGSVDEALAGMSKTGAPRKPMGTAAVTGAKNSSGAATGTKRPKSGTSGDPTAAGTRKARSNVMGERMGAQYGITARISAPVCPAAAATQGGGRLMNAATNRSGPDFRAGSAGRP